MQELQDIEITCACGEQFVWTVGEQNFMHKLKEDGRLNGDVVPPKRCKSCRDKKRAEREARQ